MFPTSRTSIVYNVPNKLFGLPPYYYRLRACDTNLTSNTPANQYQRLKLIQNTVRVYASLYTSNLGPLSAYQNPGVATHNVCWNQMSDRVVPSVQRSVIPSGTNCSLNRKTTSVTSSRPGCQSPGGIGCDIKHNSYDRYLNRLKAKGPLRRGTVSPTFGIPFIPFDPAYPVYGGKTLKTNIVTGCDCPISTNKNNIQVDDMVEKNTILETGVADLNQVDSKQFVTTNNITTNNMKTTHDNNVLIYNDPLYQPYPSGSEFSFNIGEYVYAIQRGNYYYTRAIIEHKYNNLTYLIQFDDGVSEIQTINSLLPYYPCNCGGQINSKTYSTGFLVTNSRTSDFYYSPLYPEYVPNLPVL